MKGFLIFLTLSCPLAVIADEVVAIRDTFKSQCGKMEECDTCNGRAIPGVAQILDQLKKQGKDAEFAQQMVWAVESAKIAKEKLLKSYTYYKNYQDYLNLKQVGDGPLYKERNDNLKKRILSVANLLNEKEKLIADNRHFNEFFSSCPIGDDSCRQKVKDSNEKFKKSISMIDTAINVYYGQEPLLIDSSINQCVDNMRKNPAPVNDSEFCFGKFNENLKQAVGENIKGIYKGILAYSDVVSNQASLMSMLLGQKWKMDEASIEALKNEIDPNKEKSFFSGIKDFVKDKFSGDYEIDGRVLMSELVLTSEKNSSPLLAQLDHAACLSEQNVLSWDLNKIANQYGRDQLIIMASLGGSLLVQGAKGYVALMVANESPRAKLAAAASRLSSKVVALSEIASNIPNFIDVQAEMRKCESMRRSTMVGLIKDYQGQSVSKAYIDCREGASTMAIMSALAGLGTGVAVNAIVSDGVVSVQKVDKGLQNVEGKSWTVGVTKNDEVKNVTTITESQNAKTAAAAGRSALAPDTDPNLKSTKRENAIVNEIATIDYLDKNKKQIDLIVSQIKAKGQGKNVKPKFLEKFSEGSSAYKEGLKNNFHDVYDDFPNQTKEVDEMLSVLRKKGYTKNEAKDLMKKIKCICVDGSCRI